MIRLGKLRGTGASAPPRVSLEEVLWSWIGGLAGIGAIAWIERLVFTGTPYFLVLGSFGASAVLVFGAARSPLAQPRNVVGGHLVSALVGVACQQLLGAVPGVAAAAAVATAIAAMHLTRTLHPPGGATALIAVVGGAKVHALGLGYVLVPAGLGACVLVLVGVVVNNLAPGRRYPEYWL